MAENGNNKPSYPPPSYPPMSENRGQNYSQPMPNGDAGYAQPYGYQGQGTCPPPQGYYAPGPAGYNGYGLPPQGMSYAPQPMYGPPQRPVSQGDACCAGFLAALCACCVLDAIF